MKKIRLLTLFTFISVYSFATTIVVTNTLDAGAGSLRNAVSSAVANDTIRFSPLLISTGSTTINLNTTITANNNITIKGLYNSQDTLFISGQNTVRLFNFYGTSVNLDSLVLIKGRSTTGGCISIAAFGTTSYLTNSILRGNVATQKGGAIHFYNGNFYILNSSITNNTATSDGGAIYYQIGGFLYIEKCAINNNSTITSGGALFVDGSNTASVEIYRSVLNNNTSNSDGGAIMYKGRYMTIDSCTFINNSAGGVRKGIIAVDLRNATPKIESMISGCTIANNTGCGIVSNVSLNNSTGSESIVSLSYCSIHHNTDGGVYSYCSSPDANAQSFVDVSYSTIAYNGNASGNNGGIYSQSFVLNPSYASSSSVYVVNSTIIYNTSSGNGCGVFSYGRSGANSYISSKSSIIGFNTGGMNILSYTPASYNIQSNGFNIFSETGLTYAVGTDQTGVTVANANLSALGNHGGYGQTMRPMPGSYALNAGTITDMSYAQNGPVQGGRRDIGAAEFIQCVTQGSSMTQSACSIYTWSAQTYTTSGVYTRTVSNANGCDSTITLNLTINQPSSRSLTQTACSSYTLNAQTYTISGVYTQTLTNSKGCDSLLTINLTINQPTSRSITQIACNSYAINSQTYTTSGVYTQTLTNSAGCDSIITLNLTIKQPTIRTLTQSACNSYTLNSQVYNTSGVYTQTLTNAAGCDSIITLNLTIKQPTSRTLTQSACNSYTLNSQVYSASGVYTQTLTNVAGCDSIITLNLTIKQPTSRTLTQSACNSYTLNSQVYNTSGVYTQTLTNVAGCDSLLTVDLTIDQVDNTVLQNGLILSANESGATYQWLDCNNGNQPLSGEISQSYTASTNGSYAVVITKNSCVKTSTCISINNVGVYEKNNSQNITIYPNPNHGKFTVTFIHGMQSYSVTDVLGNILFQAQLDSSDAVIDMVNFSNGVYFMKLIFDNGTSSIKRFIISK